MVVSKAHLTAFRSNLILSALPSKEYECLYPYLEPATLSKGKMLYAAGDTVRYAYFITSGMVSLLSTTGDGKAIEVGMIGNEGVAGLSVILGFDEVPYQAVVQLPGAAIRIKSGRLKAEFKKGGQLHDLLLRYTHTVLTQLSQSASCNIFHTVKERLCRWLLTSREFVHSDTLYLTQELLSQMIGTPRTNVTMIVGNLQRDGLIMYRRGKVQIIDRAGLELASCECYGIVKESVRHYIAA